MTTDSDFEVVINCCDDPVAFTNAIAKTAKGGRLSFFSGLAKNRHMDTDIVNLMHYNEHILMGSYGCTIKDMRAALSMMKMNQHVFTHLIEDIISPDDIPGVMEKVYSGKPLKYIIQFSNIEKETKAMASIVSKNNRKQPATQDMAAISEKSKTAEEVFHQLLPVDLDLRASAHKKMDKPGLSYEK